MLVHGRNDAADAPDATPIEERPGEMLARWQVPRPVGYVVFDCETTGTDSTEDEIVSFALVRLDADGAETYRLARLVRPAQPIPSEATAVHGIADEDVRDAPPFAAVADEVRDLLGTAVFVAHNVRFDLAMLQHAFARVGIDYRPPATACTLESFRLLEPRADNHRLESICARRGIPLHDAHEATSDVLATVALLRVLLDAGIAPETVSLDETAYQRVRSRGDTRPASEPQIRRVYGMARSAGLLRIDGTVDPDLIGALVREVVGSDDVDALTRSQVQDVYDALDEMIEQRAALPPAASA